MLRDILKSFFHPKELQAIFNLKYAQISDDNVYSSKPYSTISKLEKSEFCYAILHKVSRSFAAVIQQLPDEIRDAICVFYLVLRGLDSVEDDMSISKEHKRQLLAGFYEKNFDLKWNLPNVGDSEGYKLLLEKYEQISHTFACLDPKYQEVITDITLEMGQGMAQFIDQKIKTIEDYNLYCHYVAGLVGIGLSRIFALSGLEDKALAENTTLANSMGLFLQKTNIIRDIYEDLEEDRKFWPAEVWKLYVNKEKELIEYPITQNKTYCLNHLVTEALHHAPDCIEYLSMIKDPNIFRFCAIPQVMAIATLNEIYDNQNVFKRNVKIRKGLAAWMIWETNTIEDVKNIFKNMALKIFKKVTLDDPNCEEIISHLGSILHDNEKEGMKKEKTRLRKITSFIQTQLN